MTYLLHSLTNMSQTIYQPVSNILGLSILSESDNHDITHLLGQLG
jgi:hypothetical protein